MSKFVLSSSDFDTIKKAEQTVNRWKENDQLDNRDVKLYKVVEVYDLKLKFVKRRKK